MTEGGVWPEKPPPDPPKTEPPLKIKVEPTLKFLLPRAAKKGCFLVAMVAKNPFFAAFGGKKVVLAPKSAKIYPNTPQNLALNPFWSQNGFLEGFR